MAMVVEITNVTDAPDSKKKPTQVAVYTQKLNPGEILKLPAHMVDARLRRLETEGYVAIGQVPSWYKASKRHGRTLSAADAAKNASLKSERLKAKAQKATRSAPKTDEVKEEKTDTKKRR